MFVRMIPVGRGRESLTCKRGQKCSLCGDWGREGPASPAYEGKGQLVKEVKLAEDGSGRLVYYSEKSERYPVKLCRGCLDRVLGQGLPHA